MTEKVHHGWRASVGVHVDCYSVLDAMGHRKAFEDNIFADTFWSKHPCEDRELARLCWAPFKRNLKGASMCKSQYGLPYVEFGFRYPPEVEEAIGTAKARDLIQKQMVAELEKLAVTHPVAVWRMWPEIDRAAGMLGCYMRLHVMTEAQYQHFAQSE